VQPDLVAAVRYLLGGHVLEGPLLEPAR
jgi:hypothetical protein